jgi:hypothetical protein
LRFDPRPLFLFEVFLHVRICAGGGWQQPSLPR